MFFCPFQGNAITEMYEILKSQQSDVVGIFTAKKNSQVFCLVIKCRLNLPDDSVLLKASAGRV